MIGLATVAAIVIAMLLIINRQTVPGLANVLYIILGACALMWVVSFSGLVTPAAITFGTATLCSAAVSTFAGAVGAFALMGYQNRAGSIMYGTGYAVVAIITSAVAYYLGGDLAAYGAVAGAVIPLFLLLFLK